MFLKLKIIQTDQDRRDNICATDVGYLLHKNPFGKSLKFDIKLGDTYLYFNKKSNEECTLSMVMDVDNLDLFKKANRGELKQESLDHYVHNKGYTMSSIFTQAMSKVFGTCMSGNCKDKPDLVSHKWKVELKLSTIETKRMGEEFLTKMFMELGYEVELEKLLYDKDYDEWGLSNNYNLTLKHDSITIQDLMTQLYVLIPVINPERHFYVDESTMNGLINKGGSWLSNHSLKDIIVKRYLVNDKELSNSALNQMKTESDIKKEQENREISEGDLEKKESLGEKRHNKIIELLKEQSDFRTFVDYGCSDAKLIRRALEVNSDNPDPDSPHYFKSIIGVDVAYRTLSYQENKMKREYKGTDKLDRINLVVSSLMYQDPRLLNQEAFVLSEVIEHIDIEKHDIVLDNLFNYYSPNIIIITTPNKDYNKIYEIPDNKMRHRDHRFEWTSLEFKNWCTELSDKYNHYQLETKGYIGDVDSVLGGSCQYVVFRKKDYTSRKISDRTMIYSIQKDSGIRIDKVLTDKWIPTRYNQAVEIRKEKTLEPLHNLSRFSVPFEQLIYIPPTMSPVESGSHNDYLEYPTDAFKYYKEKGVTQVICETKHMGSRMITLVCKNDYTAQKLFNLKEGNIGVSWTRTGRRFFYNPETEKEIHENLNKAITNSGLWSELKTDWILLDSEMLPWNYHGEYGLIVKQYANIGCSGINTIQKSMDSMNDYSMVNQEDDMFNKLKSKYESRLESVKKFTKSYRNYIWKINSTKDLKIAPFHILATSKTVHDTKNHLWHMDMIKKLTAGDTTGLIRATDFVCVDLNDPEQIKQACRAWEEETNLGAEGWVIKPIDFLQKDSEGSYIQPAIKCRGKEYLRIIYGAEYTLPETMPKLRKRNVKKKRYLAMNEFLLGLEGLHRFSQNSDLESIHECVYGVMTLDATEIDPRL